MPVATSALIAGGISAAGGIAQTISGASQARKARKAIEGYRRQNLDNAFEDIQISTLGSDLIREESGRTTAMGVDALRQGDVRAVMGGLPKIIAQNNLMNRQAQIDLDQQQQRREYAVAQDEARIRNMQERREEQDLAGLGQQLDVGRDMMWNGLGTVANSGMFMANNFTGGGSTPQVSSINSGMQSMGPTPLSGGADFSFPQITIPGY